MKRFWLQQYPKGMPADVDVHQYSSLIELFEESFTTFVDRKAAICMDKAITYGELDEMSAAIGAYLQSRGLAKGARVAVMMPNVLQNPVALTAAIPARRPSSFRNRLSQDRRDEPFKGLARIQRPIYSDAAH
jgi:long-chain acyl-CoA synthetase